MGRRHLSRRQLLAEGGRLALGVAGMAGLPALACTSAPRDVVSIVRIQNGKVEDECRGVLRASDPGRTARSGFRGFGNAPPRVAAK